MTTDEIKQALREMKERCENTLKCSVCPFAVREREGKHCIVNDLNGDAVTPCEWHLDFAEDCPAAKPDATGQKYMNKGREIGYDRMIDAACAAIIAIEWATHVLGNSMDDISKMDIDKLRPRYHDGFDPERSRNREEEHEDHH